MGRGGRGDGGGGVAGARGGVWGAGGGVWRFPRGTPFPRHMERQADDYSFTTMGRPEPLIAGLERLARRNLAEVEPPRWKEILFYSHPAIATRIRRARAVQTASGS